MTAGKDKFVTINYTLKDDEDYLIDTSLGKEPLSYIHGNNFLLPKLEEIINGKNPGDKFSAVLEPVDGYGERDERLIAKVPRENFPEGFPVETGMHFQADTPAGPQIVKVVEVGDKEITVDANHELAGVRLHFNIESLDVREATQEDFDALNRGGCGGHCGGGCGGCGGDCGGCGGDCNEEGGCGGNCGCK